MRPSSPTCSITKESCRAPSVPSTRERVLASAHTVQYTPVTCSPRMLNSRTWAPLSAVLSQPPRTWLASSAQAVELRADNAVSQKIARMPPPIWAQRYALKVRWSPASQRLSAACALLPDPASRRPCDAVARAALPGQFRAHLLIVLSQYRRGAHLERALPVEGH